MASASLCNRDDLHGETREGRSLDSRTDACSAMFLKLMPRQEYPLISTPAGALAIPPLHWGANIAFLAGGAEVSTGVPGCCDDDMDCSADPVDSTHSNTGTFIRVLHSLPEWKGEQALATQTRHLSCTPSHDGLQNEIRDEALRMLHVHPHHPPPRGISIASGVQESSGVRPHEVLMCVHHPRGTTVADGGRSGVFPGETTHSPFPTHLNTCSVTMSESSDTGGSAPLGVSKEWQRAHHRVSMMRLWRGWGETVAVPPIVADCDTFTSCIALSRRFMVRIDVDRIENVARALLSEGLGIDHAAMASHMRTVAAVGMGSALEIASHALCPTTLQP